MDKEKTADVNAVSFYPRQEIERLELRKPENKLKPSIVEPPTLELKELPSNLEYVFLQGEDQLPVIISSSLNGEQKGKLLGVLKNTRGL